MKKSLFLTLTLAVALIIPTAAQTPSSKIGILWSSWHPDHFKEYQAYITKMQGWGNGYVSLNPTYFLDTYDKGILTEWDGQTVTPDITLQKTVIKELIAQGFYINYRPHVDPIKFAMPEGDTRTNWSTDPGGKDWRGEFDKMNPIDPTIGYREKVVLPGLQMLAEAIRESKKAGYTLISPIRFDLGAELMDAMVNYPNQWITLRDEVRQLLNTTYADVKTDIVLGHNFCHHIEYLMRLPGHEDYFRRIMADQTTVGHEKLLYLDRPGVTEATRHAIGQYIAGLDEISLSQYMPLDIFSEDGRETTTPDEVYTALLWHEQNFINECLVKECNVPINKLPILHIGEYGMGWRGLNAPNVWDIDAWNRAGYGSMILSDSEQKKDAYIAIDGIIKYVDESSPTNYRSFLLWFGGKPYDLLNLNSYSNWYNDKAAESLRKYWASHKGMPSLDKPTNADFGVEQPETHTPTIRIQRLLDDFEDYSSDSELQAAWQRNGNGAKADISLNTTLATQGLQCMQLDYDLTGNTYAGIIKSGSSSVSGFDGMYYSLIPDGSGADLLLQVQDGDGHYWKSTIQLTGTEKRDVFLPFSDFVGGYNTSGSWTNPSNIVEAAFYVEKGTKGTIYIDNLRASLSPERIDSIQQSTDVAAPLLRADVSVYPNPATDYAVFHAPEPIRCIQLFDIHGHKVLEYNNYTQSDCVLVLTQLLNSTYLYRMITEGSTYSGHIIVQ